MIKKLLVGIVCSVSFVHSSASNGLPTVGIQKKVKSETFGTVSAVAPEKIKRPNNPVCGKAVRVQSFQPLNLLPAGRQVTNGSSTQAQTNSSAAAVSSTQQMLPASIRGAQQRS